jgi:hypothetical protein
MSANPTLTGQDIKLAERATRGVLDVLLAETDTTFMQMVVVNATAGEGPVVAIDRLVQRLAVQLRVAEPQVRDTIDELLASGLLTLSSGDREAVELSADGQERFERLRAGSAQITERLYSDLPVDDLVTARRVLATLTERANAELSGRAPAAGRHEA